MCVSLDIEHPILMVSLGLPLLRSRRLTRWSEEGSLLGQVLNGPIRCDLGQVQDVFLNRLPALVRECIVEMDDGQNVATECLKTRGLNFEDVGKALPVNTDDESRVQVIAVILPRGFLVNCAPNAALIRHERVHAWRIGLDFLSEAFSFAWG